jgi:hypothetical protein
MNAINTLLTTEHTSARSSSTRSTGSSRSCGSTPRSWAISRHRGLRLRQGLQARRRVLAHDPRRLTALQERGMVVICIAHSIDQEVRRAGHRRVRPLSDQAARARAALVSEWADVIGFAHLETVTVTKGKGTTKSTKGQTSGAACSPSRSAPRTRRRTATACRRDPVPEGRRVGRLRGRGRRRVRGAARRAGARGARGSELPPIERCSRRGSDPRENASRPTTSTSAFE